MIESALHGKQECDRLRHELALLKYNPDLRRMLHNIDNMLTDISKLEVVCRQRKTVTPLQEPLARVTESIDHLEKLILIAKLMD